MSAFAMSAAVRSRGRDAVASAPTSEKRTSSVPLKRAMSRASSPPSMISPPSIDWSAISDAPTPLLRISACPTALSAELLGPDRVGGQVGGGQAVVGHAPVSTLPARASAW